MSPTPSQNEPAGPAGRTWLRRLDQATIAVILAISIVVMSISMFYRARQSAGLIEIDHSEPVEVDFKIDINQADWPEFTLLPRVGETLAKRIIDDRQRHGPFLNHDDLQRVSGIGPRTLDDIRPYLLPLPDAKGLAER